MTTMAVAGAPSRVDERSSPVRPDASTGARTAEEADRWGDGPGSVVSSRGRTTVTAQVVEKIAAQTAWEIAGTVGHRAGFLGLGGHADVSKRPKVSAELTGDVAVLQVELGVRFPAPIRRLVREVQQTLTRQVSRLAGVAVARIDVEVTWMSVDSRAGGRRGENGRGELL